MKNLKGHLLRLIKATVFLVAFMYITTACNAQSAARSSLLALSKTDHTLAIVDPVSLKVQARIPVGVDPHEVIASTDGKTAYVSIYGGGSLHEINVIDLVAQKPATTIDTRPLFGPHGLTFVNEKVWFSAEGSKAVGRYDPASGKLDWSMGTGERGTHMLYVTADEKKLYTTNMGSGTVSILEDGQRQNGQAASSGGQRHAEWNQTVVAVTRGSEGFDVSPDSSELWTVSGEDGVISIIDLKAKKRVAQIDAKVVGANRLKFTPDGRTVFISSLRSGKLTIYDVKTRTQKKQIDIGTGAAGILMDPDGSRVFVACTADNYVAVIDTKTLAVTQRIDVGGGPDGLAWAGVR